MAYSPAGHVAPAPQGGAKPLPAPRWTGSSAAALMHAVLGVVIGVTLLVEPPGGYLFPVFEGPKAVTGFLPGDPLVAWAVIYIACSAAVIIARGAPVTRWALALLSGAWAAWGVGALAVGLTSPDAASIAGWVWIAVACMAWRDALALGRRRS